MPDATAPKPVNWKNFWMGLLAVSTSISVIGAAASVILNPVRALAEDREAVKAAVKTAEEAKAAVKDVQTSVNAVLQSQHRAELDMAGVQAAMAQLKESVARQERNSDADRKEIIELLKMQGKREAAK